MKTKKLRPWARNTVTAITIMCGILAVSVNDFNLSGFFVWLGIIAIMLCGIKILEKY